MNGRLIYGLLLFVLMLYSTWQWMHVDTPVLKTAIVPPALPKVSMHKKQLKTILAHNLWDKSRGASKHQLGTQRAEKKHVVLSWVLKGIGYQHMRASVAMIASGNHVTLYHEGDRLPDETLLMQVMVDGILVDKDGEEKRVYLFKKK